jgi:precorrin-4/cobalt-precorrin-4 C11-methyltransferase
MFGPDTETSQSEIDRSLPPALTPVQPDHSSSDHLPAAVYLIGAGPGDPDLLTVKAQRILQQADLILVADSLVPPQILRWARAEAEVVQTADKTLEETVPLMIARVEAGQIVVRLQSGDPSLYSTLHEQIQLLRVAQVPVEVVPGISAFQAAAARLQVELTIPELVQTVILTRIQGRTAMPEAEALASLAAHQASLCLYLSARHVEQAQTELLRHYPPDTGVAVCFRLGWPDEKIWLVPLNEMSHLTQAQNLTRTTLYVISPALNAAQVGLSARSRLYSSSHSRLFRPSSAADVQPS